MIMLRRFKSFLLLNEEINAKNSTTLYPGPTRSLQTYLFIVPFGPDVD